jgi:Putative auto-transporter adhesin, head GIN domain
MKKMNLCLSVAAIAAAVLQVSVVNAQVKVAAPGVDASVSGKGVSVNAPGVSIKVDIPADFDVNDPTGDGKKAAAKSATTKSNVKSAGGAGISRSTGVSTGGKCVDGVLRVVSSGSGDSKYSSLSCARVEVVLSSSGHVSVGDISAKSVLFKSSGSGDLKVGKLTADQLDIDNSSAGHVTIDQGSTTALSLVSVGSGDLNASGMVAQNVKADLRSSGHANVNAAQSIAGNLSGSGDLRYAGGATAVAVNTSSSGTFGKMY